MNSYTKEQTEVDIDAVQGFFLKTRNKEMGKDIHADQGANEMIQSWQSYILLKDRVGGVNTRKLIVLTCGHLFLEVLGLGLAKLALRSRRWGGGCINLRLSWLFHLLLLLQRGVSAFFFLCQGCTLVLSFRLFQLL